MGKGGFDANNRLIDGVAFCPSVPQSGMDYFNGTHNNKFIEFTYSYFGRVDIAYKDRPSHIGNNSHEEVVSKELDPNKVLMNDVIDWDDSDDAYRYNHGNEASGWRWAFNELNGLNGEANVDKGPFPKLWAGGNRFFGDGHGKWVYSKQYSGPLTNRSSNHGFVGLNDAFFY